MDELTEIQYYPLDDVQREFLKYAPQYAQVEAKQAIAKIIDLQTQGVLRQGLYYIVLVDLVGSTQYMADHGNAKAALRIELFVKSSFDALNEIKLRNIGMFVKEMGDAVLYIFQHFPDVLRWRAAFDRHLRLLGSVKGRYEIRTCVHLGEVFLDGVNPLSLAVSHTFKIEKQVGSDEIVLTDPAYSVAWPTIARAYHAFETHGSVKLYGYTEPVVLYRLRLHDQDDIERIAIERFEQ